MTELQVHQFPCLADNYGYLIHDPSAKVTAAIDTPEVEPILQALEHKGWALTHILNTHHHFDHAGGNLALKEKWPDIAIVGAAADAERIPGITVKLADGDSYPFGRFKAEVFDVSGHTIGHIAYYFPAAAKLFCGDALFALGCGRLFEGTPAQMWASLSKLKALPEATQVYCAHEYTQANAAFALTVEPQNAALVQRCKDIDALRAAGKPTVPTSIGLEKATNPFLRPDSAALQANLQMPGAELVEVFAETRRRKDSF